MESCFVKILFQIFKLQELAKEQDDRSRSDELPQDKNLVVEVPLGSRNAVFNFDDEDLLDRKIRQVQHEDRYWRKVFRFVNSRVNFFHFDFLVKHMRMREVYQMNCHKIRTWWWKCLSDREMLCLTLTMKTY